MLIGCVRQRYIWSDLGRKFALLQVYMRRFDAVSMENDDAVVLN